jgi:hypothetical protein
VSLTTLTTLPTADLIDEIAIEQWAIIVDRAEGLFVKGEDGRADLRKLQASSNADDRYVAMLVTRWIRNG